MCHALIIEDNMIISRAIQDRLALLGFNSFDHAWTGEQAIEAAAIRSPDLVVVGDAAVGGSALDVAQCISVEQDIPILMITADRCQVQRRLPEGASLIGPFHLSQIENAVTLACER